jgi:hypothetical protein
MVEHDQHTDTTTADAGTAHGQPTQAALDDVLFLVRHWGWADQARALFESELLNGWDYDEDLAADHPFGSYYHWCALLAGLGEAALTHVLLRPMQLEAIREEFEAILPELLACREILVSIPASFEDHPRVVDLLRDEERLGRLRRLHGALGNAIHRAHDSRSLSSIDP